MTKQELKEHCIKIITYLGTSEKTKDEHELVLKLLQDSEQKCYIIKHTPYELKIVCVDMDIQTLYLSPIIGEFVEAQERHHNCSECGTVFGYNNASFCRLFAKSYTDALDKFYEQWDKQLKENKFRNEPKTKIETTEV